MQGSAAYDMATQQTDRSSEAKQFSVLLVEDDMCTRTLVASLLNKCSYKGVQTRWPPRMP